MKSPERTVCLVLGPKGYICNQPANHTGDHQAEGLGRVLEIWKNETNPTNNRTDFMPTFKPCEKYVHDMADGLMREFETHSPLLDSDVKIDFIFAFPNMNDAGEPLGDAIKHHGCKALGLCRKLSLKDRAMGRGDAEILIDGPWWEAASENEQRALLDHELHHIEVVVGKTDDLRRPVLKMRKHDYEFGWFKIIAERHGSASIEQKQASKMMDNAGQFFWPSFLQPIAKAA